MAQGPPVKVFILSGQSNMVGAGKVDGGSQRWGNEFLDPVVSVYEGNYDPDVDYDLVQPKVTKKLEKFGGTEPTPYPGGDVQGTRRLAIGGLTVKIRRSKWTLRTRPRSSGG